MHLLIADSDPTLSDLYESYFASFGYDVEIAGSGIQCLERIQRRMPDALVLEYELPWGGGDGVLAQLRGEYPSMPVGVVLISNDYAIEVLNHERTPPVMGCLRKPFRLHELEDVVRSILSSPSPKTTRHVVKQRAAHLGKRANSS
jgi:two-component system response regulator MprA